MRNQSLLITACAVFLLLLLAMPIVSAVEYKTNASYDGSVGYNTNTTWTPMRNNVSGSNTVRELQNNTYSGETYSVATGISGYYLRHWRGLITWDTSAIPDSATITSATVSVYGHDKTNGLGQFNFAIIDANPLNKLAYGAGDYDKTTFTRMAPDIAYSSFSNDGWNNFTLNSQGLSAISKTGLTTFMFTHSADVDNSSLSWVNDSLSAFEIKGVNDSVEVRKPFITINYDLPALPVLTVSASPTTVTVGTPTNVNFTVKNQSSGLVVSGATVGLTGLVTDSGTTDVNGNATFSVTAASVGTITATASMAGYTGNTTTVAATAPLPVLTVSASPTTVTVGTPTNVNFTVKNQSSGLVVSGATVGLTGLVTDSGTTDVNGNATFSVTAASAGTITATASKTGYTQNTTTVTANPLVSTMDKIGVYKDGVWYLDWNGSGAWDQGTDKQDYFGAAGWTSVSGDWNPAVPSTKIGVYKDGVWYLDWNGNGAWDQGTDKEYYFGAAGWTPVSGDWNPAVPGTKIGVYKDGVWYLDWNGNGAWDQGTDKQDYFGAADWTPVVADWNPAVPGTKIGVYQNGVWYLDWNGNGAWEQGTDKQDYFGAAGWTPVVADWNPAVPGTKIGVFKDGVWYLDWNGNGAWDQGTDKQDYFGAALWTSVVGKWS
jgi:hypothetical protein